jgi:hypothetical protein
LGPGYIEIDERDFGAMTGQQDRGGAAVADFACEGLVG